MSEAWGTTGRVTLDAHAVIVDGYLVGYVPADGGYAEVVTGLSDAPRRHGRPWARIPSRDAAVMWVLRRTAPDVWRAERPVVWRVLRAWERFPVLPWHIHGSAGSDHDAGYCVLEHEGSAANAEYAIKVADRNARAEYARAAR